MNEAGNGFQTARTLKDKLGEFGLLPPNITNKEKESMDHSEFSSYHNNETKSENCNIVDSEIQEE